jgi:hypothetical protein
MPNLRKKRVKFSFLAPQGTRDVKLCGDFTSWEQGAIVMKSAKSGEWTAMVSVEPGEHQYKFLADGNWYADPKAGKWVNNEFGSQNSVRLI